MVRQHRWLAAALVAITLGVTSTVALICYQLFAPQPKIFEVKQAQWPITRNTYPGSGVWTHISFCKSQDLPSSINRMLVGTTSQGEQMLSIAPTVGGRFPVGCREVTVKVFDLPLDLPPGHYKVLMFMEYHPNNLRTHVEYFETQVFEVR